MLAFQNLQKSKYKVRRYLSFSKIFNITVGYLVFGVFNLMDTKCRTAVPYVIIVEFPTTFLLLVCICWPHPREFCRDDSRYLDPKLGLFFSTYLTSSGLPCKLEEINDISHSVRCNSWKKWWASLRIKVDFDNDYANVDTASPINDLVWFLYLIAYQSSWVI